MAVSKDLFILVLFAVIMALAALSMIAKPRYRLSLTETPSPARTADAPVVGTESVGAVKVSIPLAALEGTVIGVFTGVVGAGGGFAIVPALVVLSRLPMRVAVGTSLTIIAAKSLAGFAGDVALQADFDWGLLLAFTALAVVGILAGSRIGRHVPGARLRPAFGWFVLVAAAGILVRELLLG